MRKEPSFNDTTKENENDINFKFVSISLLMSDYRVVSGHSCLPRNTCEHTSHGVIFL